ncbi:cupin domain-containing protein [Corynebacterium suranareeae]|uniref:Cupin domain-containing protein n=1 Tax=Corynebacterium suranareeae TaxID=2506452 RepID=A0A160PRT7_9CORY|nr:cupin domain-containing protein [Corynebacterium suranareeae]BAU96386.1 cupin domain-containing protein [Corynebacterium suranareeae]
MSTFNILHDAPAPQPDKNRPGVKRILQGDGANLIAFTFSPGQSLPDHRAAHPITVTAFSGQLTFGVGDETYELLPGAVVHLEAGITHRVDCPQDAEGNAVMLLTMLTGEKH